MFSSLFKSLSRRLIFSLIFIFATSAVAFALYAQFYQNAEPCPLCIAQRVFYTLIAFFALCAAFNNCKTWGNCIYAIIILAIALFGAKIAHHHVWLQSLPPEQWPASCGMPLEILYKKIPLSGFIKTVLTGTAECAAVDWKVLGISGPLVSMYGYILIALMAIYTLMPRKLFMKHNNA